MAERLQATSMIVVHSLGKGVDAGAQVGGHGVEGGEVEAGQAGTWATEVNSFYGESLPGHARTVRWVQIFNLWTGSSAS